MPGTKRNPDDPLTDPVKSSGPKPGYKKPEVQTVDEEHFIQQSQRCPHTVDPLQFGDSWRMRRRSHPLTFGTCRSNISAKPHID